jgi:hypothetical protein
MEIYRTNHTRPTDNHTDRIQVYPHLTKNFRVNRAPSGGIMFEARCLDYDWTVTLSLEETALVQQCLDPH